MPDVKALVLVQPKNGDKPTLGSGGQRDIPHEMWLKRQAVNLVSLLPDDHADALKVLELAREVVKQWWRVDPGAG